VPEPMREAPEYEQTYYIPKVGDSDCGSIESTWDNHPIDESRLAHGLCHLTAEAAELHAKALLSFTRRDE